MFPSLEREIKQQYYNTTNCHLTSFKNCIDHCHQRKGYLPAARISSEEFSMRRLLLERAWA